MPLPLLLSLSYLRQAQVQVSAHFFLHFIQIVADRVQSLSIGVVQGNGRRNGPGRLDASGEPLQVLIQVQQLRAQIKHDKTSLYFPGRCGIIKFTGPPGLVLRVLVLLARLANTLFLGRFDSQSNQLQQRIPG